MGKGRCEARQSLDGYKKALRLRAFSVMLWRSCCGLLCPREEVAFLCQSLVLFVVICTCLYNLTFGGEDSRETLWISLLSASLGIYTPDPVSAWHYRLSREREDIESDGIEHSSHECDKSPQQQQHGDLPG